MPLRKIAILATAIGLAACATKGDVYHPARFEGGEGFSERQVAENRYRITFKGDAYTSRDTVEDYLLLRAAELSMEKGKVGFALTEVHTDSETHVRGARRPAIYGRYAHRLRDEPWSFPYYAYGYDWSYPAGWSLYEIEEFVAVAYARLLDAGELAATPDAFEAKTTLANIGPVSCYKKETHDETNCPFRHSHD